MFAARSGLRTISQTLATGLESPGSWSSKSERERDGLSAGGKRIRTINPALGRRRKMDWNRRSGLLTFDHEELVGRGFGPPNLAFATTKLPHAGIAVG